MLSIYILYEYILWKRQMLEKELKAMEYVNGMFLTASHAL